MFVDVVKEVVHRVGGVLRNLFEKLNFGLFIEGSILNPVAHMIMRKLIRAEHILPFRPRSVARHRDFRFEIFKMH